MADAIEHEQYDAIIMSMSAITLMANNHYQQWINYSGKHNHAASNDDKQFFARCRDRHAKALRTACENLNGAMEYLGDLGNAIDLVDEYGMTDAAFETMRRALGSGKEEQEAGS